MVTVSGARPHAIYIYIFLGGVGLTTTLGVHPFPAELLMVARPVIPWRPVQFGRCHACCYLESDESVSTFENFLENMPRLSIGNPHKSPMFFFWWGDTEKHIFITNMKLKPV